MPESIDTKNIEMIFSGKFNTKKIVFKYCDQILCIELSNERAKPIIENILNEIKSRDLIGERVEIWQCKNAEGFYSYEKELEIIANNISPEEADLLFEYFEIANGDNLLGQKERFMQLFNWCIFHEINNPFGLVKILHEREKC